jgi:hypothetical protein
MTRSPFTVPLRPAYEEAEAARFRAFWRALTAFVLAQLSRQDPEDVVRRTWEHDQAAHLITRGIVEPSSTIGWGAESLSTVIGPFLSGIATRSAAARLLAEALRIQLAGCSMGMSPGFAPQNFIDIVGGTPELIARNQPEPGPCTRKSVADSEQFRSAPRT